MFEVRWWFLMEIVQEYHREEYICLKILIVLITQQLLLLLEFKDLVVNLIYKTLECYIFILYIFICDISHNKIITYKPNLARFAFPFVLESKKTIVKSQKCVPMQ